MSYNGSGSFLINTAGQPVVSGTVISSTAFNALTADLATGLSTCITKDGQTTVTANIPMAGYKFTGLGAGSGAADSANLSQVQSTVVKLLASVSGTDTITAVGSPTVAAYAAGQMFYFVAAGDNTGAVTINIDSLGAKAVTRDGSVALAAGDIKSGEVVVIVYDGTRFQVVSQLNSSGDARFANVSIASSLYVGGVATIVGNAGFSANVSIASALSVGGVATITGTVTGSKFVPTGNVTTGNGMYLPTTNTLAFSTDGTERLRIDSAGNAGVGTTSPQAKLVASNGGANGYELDPVNGFISAYNRSTNAWTKITTRASSYTFNISNTNDAVNIDTSGNLGVGTASPGGKIEVVSTNATTALFKDSARYALVIIQSGGSNQSSYLDFKPSGTGNGVLQVNGSDKAVITSGGTFSVGTTSENPISGGVSGVALRAGGNQGLIVCNRASADALAVGRLADDGVLVTFYQDGTQEGTISVSGNTVSYNAFAGSHWSQLQDGGKPDILRGTVMESINELCVWPGEANERLPKSKVSDTAGSKKVYGVFMAWDNDWTETNDMYVTAVGAFICRVNGSVTVQEGDLLESNGDGTARVQADDIIRSSTIGKVTSTVKTHEYDDGSYCVPTVLYCG